MLFNYLYKKLFILFVFFTTLICADFPSLGITNNINQWANKQHKVSKKHEDLHALESISINKAKAWLDHLSIDLAHMSNTDNDDKKRLSEVLGAYWMLYRYGSETEKKAIKVRVKDFYNYTYKTQYLNLLTQKDEPFKKNSMSYLRIMWLLKEMDFDISHLIKKFHTLKPRMDAHFSQRGPWQKSMFARYYDIFGFEKPQSIQHTENMTGLIGKELPLSKYKRLHAYMLTHQVFVAFDYGNKKTQTRFNPKELNYLRTKLPFIVKHYDSKKNWDLVSELLLSMTYLGLTEDKYFQAAYKDLLLAQNSNGSWGNYEHLRAKYGDSIETKYYLHTTGVALSAIEEKVNWHKK